MERLQCSLSDRASLSPLEMKTDFMDRDGVLRRSSMVTKRTLMWGASTDTMEYDSDESVADILSDNSQSSAEVELSHLHLTPLAIRPLSESEMDQRLPCEERMRRRTQFQLQLRDRKHSVLVEQNIRHQERLQLWHNAAELDPAVETTSQNTARTPSPRSNTYVDEDGNIRRRSTFTGFGAQPDDPTVLEDQTVNDEAASKPPPSPASLILGKGKTLETPPRIRTSLVLEFAQTFIDS
ncbi:unnamed protein product [Phytophthora lilii]|uniref:Unnamed protein product n=1 Tax=Phytophthora lilii TaxID=2077276 RepID=A0A9W6WR65_9STRA|nr:unnamed protein product [Phytophthora lilii]